MTRTLRHWLAGLSLTALAAGVTLAQPQQPTIQAPSQPGQAKVDDGVEVLARGPVHEAYASTVEYPTGGGPVVAKAPPDAIEELPPDQKPDGDNVQWIPGYWAYDDDRTDHIWISGFWRVAPPGRVWVPGSWREVRGGFQWVNGFWNLIAQKQQQAEIEYLPQPPALLELAPSTPAPTVTSFYTPGIWIYRANRYAWRPGYWVEHRSNWVWVGDHYRWTPVGYIHVPGYWDYTPEDRGLLFAPVYFRPNVYSRPNFFYTPSYVVSYNHLFGAMFVRRGYSSYYFGDYFEARYATAGYNSWNGVRGGGSGFALTVSIGRTVPYDPLWSYYNVHYRDDPRWARNINDGYTGRYNGDIARPPRTLVQQVNSNNTTNVTNVTNVTNITNVTNNNNMLTPLTAIRTTNPNLAMRAVASEDRVKEQKLAKEITKVSVDRRKAETAMVDKGFTVPTKATEAPRTARIDVPQTATIRAQAPATRLPPAKPSVDMKPEVKPEKPKPTPVVFPTAIPQPNKPTVPTPPILDPKPKPKPGDPMPPVVVPPKPPVTLPPVVPPKPPVTLPPVVPPRPPVVIPPVVPPKPPVTLPPVAPPKPPVTLPPVAPPRPPVVIPPVAPPRPPVVIPPSPVPVIPNPVVPPPKPPEKPKDKPKG